MKRIISVLLVSLLCFSGCGDDSGGTSAVTGQATPVAPFGIIDTLQPTYEWTPVPLATKYRLVVQETIEDSTTQDTIETYVIDEWFTAAEAGCDSEESLCIVTPEMELEGTYTWTVLACTDDDCGLWSDELEFTYPPPATPRFTDNGDGTVTDTHTDLMWTQNANLYGENDWWDATSYCGDLTLAGKSDWSLPYISELNSLIDETQVDPALPPDDPFTNVQSDFYWSSTTDVGNTNSAWGALFGDGVVSLGDKGGDGDVWCVRIKPQQFTVGIENKTEYTAHGIIRVYGAKVPTKIDYGVSPGGIYCHTWLIGGKVGMVEATLQRPSAKIKCKAYESKIFQKTSELKIVMTKPNCCEVKRIK